MRVASEHLDHFRRQNGGLFFVTIDRRLGVAGPYTIPQNWIVDGKGMLLEKSVGFDDNITDWANVMAERAARVAH